MNRSGRRRRAEKPGWAWLYPCAIPGLAPFPVLAWFVPASALRALLEIASELLWLGLLALWVRVNRIGLELQGRRVSGWRQAAMTGMGASGSGDALEHDGGDSAQRTTPTPNRPRSLDRKDFRHAGFAFDHRGCAP